MRPPLDGSILVTGASSGIGKEIARQLAAQAKALILVARRTERLEELKAELLDLHPHLSVFVMPCDLADREATDAMLARVRDECDGVDVLVNNAGMGDISLFEYSEWDKVELMLQLNIVALTYLTHQLLPGMIEKGRGGVLNISSGFGLSWLPGVSSYAGSKHYVTAFSESLRQEMRGHGVVVTQVCPGPVATEFEAVAGNPTGIEVPSLVEISAAHCARSALRGFRRDRAMVVPGFLISCAMLANALAPRFLIRLVTMPISGYLRRRQGACDEAQVTSAMA